MLISPKKVRLCSLGLLTLFLGFPATSLADSCTPGVLVKCSNVDFTTYLKELIDQVLPFVIFLAMVMVVFSGVQYMFGGLSAEQTKKAKARIWGVLGGVLFFLSIALILTLISSDLFLS